jgi:dTMP kinase
MENLALNGKRFYGRGLPGTDPASLGGKLIVIEGADGSGRTTQIGLLSEWLERLGYATVQVGLKRSRLVGRELDEAMQGNTLSPITLSLFYATDFADQLENDIIPALRSGFVVLADRYIYTLMARDIARGVDRDWVRDIYGIALVPDAVFYLKTPPEVLAERSFRNKGGLDYWESGMDIQRSGNMYECFIKYQRKIQGIFQELQPVYGLETVNGNRAPATIARELSAKTRLVLSPVNGNGAVSEEE